MEITLETAADAMAGNLEAAGAVVAATEGIIAAHARNYAASMAKGAGRYAADLIEDLESVGRVAVWEKIGAWEGRSAFASFMYDHIKGAIATEVRTQVNPGADDMAVKIFARMVRAASGDVRLAEQMCLNNPNSKERLGADRAEAARLAYSGTRSLDAPAPGADGDGLTLADTYVPPDLETAEDRNSKDRAVRRELVHMTLDSLSPLRKAVLWARACDGVGAKLEMPSADIAAVVGAVAPEALSDAWRKGCADFRKNFPLFLAYPQSGA